MSYDSIGNITSRSDVSGGATWVYHATKKHAVIQAGANTYSYDANGNAVTRNGYEIKWTSYNYPYEINGPGKKLTFSYGPDRQRYRQVYTNGSVIETTDYIGGALEKVTVHGVEDWRHYIAADGHLVAIMSRKSSGANATHYVLEDHQGSVAAITDSDGILYVNESYAAFGGRRDGADWDGSCNCTDLAKIREVSRRGYTGHEMIGGASLGLIHMNGRVQDSVTGRFLSADPFIQAPYNSQSLNRYSYTLNNPLRYTDPSGFLTPKLASPDDPPGRSGVEDCWICFDGKSVRDLFSDWVNANEVQRNHRAPTLAMQKVPVEGGSTVGGNDYVARSIVPQGTVAMGLPTSIYQQCSMAACHGNTAIPYTYGYLTEEEGRSAGLQAGFTAVTLPIGGVLNVVRGASLVARA